MNNKYKNVITQLTNLENIVVSETTRHTAEISKVVPSQKLSATNLIQYLALRNEDIRDLQKELHHLGLSSLASAESHILSQLQSIRTILGHKYSMLEKSENTYELASLDLEKKAGRLFGTKDQEMLPYIMVTFDASFADNYALIKNLLLNGMNVARINCAHDDEAVWARMINKLKKACHQTGKPCKIYMDLAGPKIRTGILNKGSKKGKVKLKEGQLIWVTESGEDFDKNDIVVSPNEPGIIPMIKKGERIYFDDGIIKGVAEKIKKDSIGVRITRVSSDKKLLKSGKGINFPDSNLDISPLTEFDIASLAFICDHADLIGYSFVRKPDDVSLLRNVIREITYKEINLIIKIETTEAVKNLPGLLLEGMKQDVFGIMIARGDLAVEIGFERMGEIQEEILWICEAAHAPVIWATQVLENLNKSGIATRSEITDAGHAAMAECVMINKGAYTIEVLETLLDILLRTSEHRRKKRFTFRPLNIAKRFLSPA